jgi:predicted transcriptional regulator
MNEKILYEARILVAGFIKNRRNELKLTQWELADRCQLGVNTIRRLEGGHFWPNLKQFVIICHALDCFFFIEENESKIDFTKFMHEHWGKMSKN